VIVTRSHAYHGTNAYGTSLSGIPAVKDGYGTLVEDVAVVEWNDAAALESLLDRLGDSVAAFIGEPLIGAGGAMPPPEGYWPAVERICRERDVLLIADEVICGFGRLGHWFGCNRFGIRPDLMTIAKGLTSGYVPMSGSLIAEKIWQTIVEHSREVGPFGHGYTYTAHPVAAAAAMANLDIIEGEGLVENARAVGAQFQRRMREAFADHPLVGHMRGEGLIMGIEMVADKASKRAFDPKHKVAARVVQCGLAEGLITRNLPSGDIIAFSPPLTVTADDVELIAGRFAATLDKAAAGLRTDGIWQG
jgi:L-2,4-diaminobutyrate transaminase